MGTIRWPLWLHEDAADHGYTNDDIQTALFDAYSSVFDILTKQQEHPIMDLFQIHMAEYQAKWKKINPRRDPTNNNIIEAASAFAFSVPILAGDASLAVDFVSDLKSHIGRQYSSLADDCVTMSIGKVLFDLVILRTYLSRPAENDLDIFELVKDNQVSRIWTDHEQALAACFGEDDTSPKAAFLTRPNPLLWGVKVLIDSNLERPRDCPLVAIQEPVEWTTSPGLTGGSRKPRHYQPPHLRLLQPGPRPKPRPTYEKKSADNTSTGKRACGTMDEVSKLTAKRERLSEEDDMESSGMLARTRRGTRKRTVVNF